MCCRGGGAPGVTWKRFPGTVSLYMDVVLARLAEIALTCNYSFVGRAALGKSAGGISLKSSQCVRGAARWLACAGPPLRTVAFACFRPWGILQVLAIYQGPGPVAFLRRVACSSPGLPRASWRHAFGLNAFSVTRSGVGFVRRPCTSPTMQNGKQHVKKNVVLTPA